MTSSKKELHEADLHSIDMFIEYPTGIIGRHTIKFREGGSLQTVAQVKTRLLIDEGMTYASGYQMVIVFDDKTEKVMDETLVFKHYIDLLTSSSISIRDGYQISYEEAKTVTKGHYFEQWKRLHPKINTLDGYF